LNAKHYFEKARVAAHSAQLLLDAGDADGACNRAYYAMFDAARGALIGSGAVPNVLEIKTHAGLISMFSLHLIKTGLVDIDASKHLNQVQEMRLIADYLGDGIDLARAQVAIGMAKDFIEKLSNLSTFSP
jgi:uncharacterized protein (UPF0332 family)